MNPSNRLLSDLVASRTYAKYLPHLQRREILEETINRTMEMYLSRFPKLSREITKAFSKVHALEVMPSMRAVQFAGPPVDANNARAYNCSYTTLSHPRKFSEGLFLLLSGCGFGFSVQKHHVGGLPRVQKPRDESRYIIPDSIEGWALALQALLDGYFYRGVRPLFDYSLIRPKGSRLLTSGSKAPGAGPLKIMLEAVERKLQAAQGRKLQPIECFDIMCLVSDCVLAGGIRRAAMICLFDRDDKAMLSAKSGDWWKDHPYRARSNNSAVLPRSEVTEEEFRHIMKQCQDSNAGEPGILWTSDPELNMGTNPCVTGDTEILTSSGYKRIDSLVDTLVEVWNGFEWSTVRPAITGTNQKLVKVTLSSGQSITCTPYHEFVVTTNYHGGTKRVQAKDLKKNHKLMKHEYPILHDGENTMPDIAYTQGFYSGDGSTGSNIIQLYWTKNVCRDRLVAVERSANDERVTLSAELANTSKTFVPHSWNLIGKLYWLSGFLDSDGCELKEGGAQAVSVDKAFLLEIQKMLTTMGVSSKVVFAVSSGMRKLPDGRGASKEYWCQESHRLCIGSVQMQLLKTLGLNCSRLKFEKTPQRDASQFVKVVSVEKAGTAEKVYCFTESKRNLGCFEGVVTGQCCEISLNPNQFCNLTTINLTTVRGEKDFLSRVHSATLIGTLQASLTDFPYLDDAWRVTTEREALLGVSMTGIADVPGLMTAELLTAGAKSAVEWNQKYAKRLGTNPAARVTAVKPEGTVSCVLGSSSGVHARKSKHYIRRFQISKDDALYHYLVGKIPGLVEDYRMGANTACVSIPQEAPTGSVLEPTETALELLNRVMLYNKAWVKPGHVSGHNRHNVSATLSIGEDEWAGVVGKLWAQRNDYTGMSCLPRDLGTYQQAPFEPISEEQFNSMNVMIPEMDLREVLEVQDQTALSEAIACSGDSCEITYLK